MTTFVGSILDLDNAQAWITFTASGGALLVAVVQFVRHRITIPLRKKWEMIESALDQLKPNGGGSLSDVIRKMNTGFAELRARVFGIVDTDKTAIYECDVEGKCTFANRALADMFGLDKAAMLGNGWLSAVAYEDRDETYKIWMACVKDRRPYDALYHVVNQRTGTHTHIKTHAEPIEVDGRLVAYRGTVEPYKAAS